INRKRRRNTPAELRLRDIRSARYGTERGLLWQMDWRGASEFVVADRGNFHRGRACRSLNSATRDGAVRHFPMSSIPRLLILGGGAVVRLLHAPALARLGWCGRAKVLEVSEKARENLRTEFPGLATEAGDFREVLADPRVRGRFDGVVVALPNHL